jgi:hypothetical protein
MTIKNKDGSVYKVRGPNPIMKEQDVWKDFTVHNMNFDQETLQTNINITKKTKKIDLGSTTKIADLKPETPLPTVPPPPKNAMVEEEINIIQNEPFELPDFDSQEDISTENTSDEKVLKPTNINEKLKNYPKDIMYCMLAEVKEKIDPLYQEKQVKISYIRNFLFENIIISESDMSLVFWSHLDFITKSSIVYPKNNSRRWWKIDKIKKAPDGMFFSCVPTVVTPNFKF